MASTFKDASKQSLVIISLQRLQVLLLNQLSLYQLESMPVLKSLEFEGGAYHAARAHSLVPSDAV